MSFFIGLFCGYCSHHPFTGSLCYFLALAIALRLVLTILLGFTNAKDKSSKRKRLLTHAIKTIGLIDSISAIVPLYFALKASGEHDVPYVHVWDVCVSATCVWMVLDVYRSNTYTISSTLIIVIALFGVCASTALCARKLIFLSNLTYYECSVLICSILRSCCALFLSSALGISFLSSFGELGNNQNRYRTLSDTSMSAAMRVSLLRYDKVRATMDVDSTFDDRCSDSEKGLISPVAPVEEFESYYSALFIAWITPLFKLAKQQCLQEGDIPMLPPQRACAPNSAAVSQLVFQGDSLLKAIKRLYIAEYTVAGILILLKSVLVFVGPVMLDQLVMAAERGEPWNVVACYIFLLFVSKLISAFVTAHYNLVCQNLSVSMSGGIKGALYEKVTRLSASSRQLYTIGNITNHYTVDTDRVVNVTVALHNFWALPLQIVVAMLLLFWVVSYAMCAGLATIILVLVINNYIAKKTKAATDRVMENKDIRMKNVSEVFGSILSLKLNSWETKFKEKILASREEELRHVWTVLLIVAVNVFLLWLAPSMVSVVTITVYAKVMHREVSAAKIFTALSLFRLLQSPLRELPGYITRFFQAWTSLERLQKFLDLEERLTSEESDGALRKYDPVSSIKLEVGIGEVLVKDAEFQWSALRSDDEFADTDETNGNMEADVRFQLIVNDLRVHTCELVVVRGSVGNGKSSLCHALLGEMPLVYGKRTVRGSVGYASQQPWIQSATLRDNILFGLPFDQVKYDRVVDACCLSQDFDQMPDGDSTFIGQRGINLSGGQKSRTALARAVYADSDVYILDDVFAALDSIVARKVFERVVLGLLRFKTRIIVTHKEDIISHSAVGRCLEVVGGEVREVGNYVESEENLFNRVVTSISVVPYQWSEDHAMIDGLLGEERGDTNSSESDDIRATDITNHSYGARGSAVDGKSNRPSQIAAEDRSTGMVGSRVFRGYIEAAGGLWVVAALISCQILWQLLSVGADFFITQWARQNDDEQRRNMDTNIGVYAALALGSGVMVLVRTLTISTFGFRAAKRLFESMLESLLHAPMCWMDRNPTGRILNRFGDDQDRVDNDVPIAIGSMLATMFNVGGSILTVFVITRYLGLFIIPAACVYYYLMRLYLYAAREVQRLQSMSKSPMLSFLSETIDGLVQMRSFGSRAVEYSVRRNEKFLDDYLSISYVLAAGNSWFSLRIQLIGSALVLLISVVLFVGSGFISSGLVALALSYSLSISDDLMALVMIWSWFEQSMVCPERILQYVDIPPEGTERNKRLFRDAPGSGSPECMDVPSHRLLCTGDESNCQTHSDYREAGVIISSAQWPTRGVIEFRHVYFKYQPTSTEYVLSDINFKTYPGEKIGIVGRTGGGKSSLTMCLFRIAELSAGSILIDGVDVSTLTLSCLRSAIEIVPQNPVLFKGSIRAYIDPFDEYSDHQIWSALEKAGMADTVRGMVRDSPTSAIHDCCKKPDALCSEIAENGENLSVGQRQMLVLSRALLREAKILVMDEATAAIDSATDKNLQRVLHQEFRRATVITIAHRIDSVIGSNRIIVMSSGSIVEFDTPENLLKNPDSIFCQLAAESGVSLQSPSSEE